MSGECEAPDARALRHFEGRTDEDAVISLGAVGDLRVKLRMLDKRADKLEEMLRGMELLGERSAMDRDKWEVRALEAKAECARLKDRCYDSDEESNRAQDRVHDLECELSSLQGELHRAEGRYTAAKETVEGLRAQLLQMTTLHAHASKVAKVLTFLSDGETHRSVAIAVGAGVSKSQIGAILFSQRALGKVANVRRGYWKMV